MSRFKRADPGCSIEFELHMRVAMLGSAHESRAPNDLTASVHSDNLFAAQSVLRGDDRPLIETAAQQRRWIPLPARLGCHDGKFAIGEFVCARRRFERYVEFVLSRDAQTIAV